MLQWIKTFLCRCGCGTVCREGETMIDVTVFTISKGVGHSAPGDGGEGLVMVRVVAS